ncbi:1-aminocyclopropane-1-carboxylate deaminase/D-cysteine desulfhydrase [Parahaliea aestuarii]|uniref:D-cysteine desulfhydrase family protein n=1 Tax=Parahaliea aestuarii TaxID=1852021 RepID=A0A5C8ZRR8_9GAMM|nr:D-cysteine desulfhydrase family protein [Parahaliea aestuarii]TXS91075.1 D-cysteine desulfhydrase family protein [Parahaliea aestuarii]
MAITYPRRVDLACTPTPLQYLPRATVAWGGGHRLWVKRDDLTGSLLSGNKVRKLEFILAHAQDGGYDTLVTCGGLQSNHCRATAFVAAQAGLKAHLLLRGEPPAAPDGNYFLDLLAGAEVEIHPPQRYFRELQALLARVEADYVAQGRRALVIPTGGSDGLGLWGYIAAAGELGDDLQSAGIDGAHLVCATGSGGTQAGLTLGAALHELPLTVWGVNVCDDEQYFIDKVADDVSDWRKRYPGQPDATVVARVLDGYVGSGYGEAGREIFDLIRDLARLEGLVLDPVYTGKAFYGMLRELERGRFADCRDIVFVHTGGIFGLMAQRNSCL